MLFSVCKDGNIWSGVQVRASFCIFHYAHNAKSGRCWRDSCADRLQHSECTFFHPQGHITVTWWTIFKMIADKWVKWEIVHLSPFLSPTSGTSYFEYYVPSISCCTPPISWYCSVYTFVLLHSASVAARIFFLFFLLCVYMSCNNIVITMGGQLR